MSYPNLTRRGLLQRLALAALTAPLVTACSKNSAAPCIDPALLGRGEEHMRKTLQYTARSINVAQDWAQCVFFKAPGAQDCGHCEILDGLVNRRGYCTSWALRG